MGAFGRLISLFCFCLPSAGGDYAFVIFTYDDYLFNFNVKLK